MRYFVLTMAILAACDDAPADNTAASSAAETRAALRATSSTVKTWRASDQTRQTFGIETWRFTQTGNGDVQFAGVKANGNDLFTQWLYQSSFGNPWTILDSGDTYAAVRQNGNEFYFDPRNEPWEWDWQESIMQAFVRDAGLILGRKIIVYAGPTPLPQPDVGFAAGGDCEPTVQQYVAASSAVGDAFNDMAAVCLFTPISNLRGAKTCAVAHVTAIAAVKAAMTRFNHVLQYCEDDIEDPIIEPPDPFEDPGNPGVRDPGQGFGTDSQGRSWFTWHDPSGSEPICFQVPGDPAFYCF